MSSLNWALEILFFLFRIRSYAYTFYVQTPWQLHYTGSHSNPSSKQLLKAGEGGEKVRVDLSRGLLSSFFKAKGSQQPLVVVVFIGRLAFFSGEISFIRIFSYTMRKILPKTFNVPKFRINLLNFSLKNISLNQCCLETLWNKKVWIANIVQLSESSIVKMLHAHQNYCEAVRSSGLVRFTSITHFLSFGGVCQNMYSDEKVHLQSSVQTLVSWLILSSLAHLCWLSVEFWPSLP